MNSAIEAFEREFAPWALKLPAADVAARRNGQLRAHGWSVLYEFGSDAYGDYLDYYAALREATDARVNDDWHARIYETGQVVAFPAVLEAYLYGRDPSQEELDRAREPVLASLAPASQPEADIGSADTALWADLRDVVEAEEPPGAEAQEPAPPHRLSSETPAEIDSMLDAAFGEIQLPTLRKSKPVEQVERPTGEQAPIERQAAAPPVAPAAPQKIAAQAPKPAPKPPEPVVAAKPEPVAAKPETVVAKPEPVVAKPEPVVVAKPEPVVAKPEPVVVAAKPVVVGKPVVVEKPVDKPIAKTTEKVEEPKDEPIVAEEPSEESETPGEPVAEEPVGEEPVGEEPVVEQPVAPRRSVPGYDPFVEFRTLEPKSARRAAPTGDDFRPYWQKYPARSAGIAAAVAAVVLIAIMAMSHGSSKPHKRLAATDTAATNPLASDTTATPSATAADTQGITNQSDTPDTALPPEPTPTSASASPPPASASNESSVARPLGRSSVPSIVRSDGSNASNAPGNSGSTPSTSHRFAHPTGS